MEHAEKELGPHELAGPGGRAKGLSWWEDVWRRFLRQRSCVVGAVVLLAVVLLSAAAPLIAPYDPNEQFRDQGLTELGTPRPPNAQFLLGTDGVGRDLLSRILWGGRTSLGVGIAAALITSMLALLIGGVAGYVGGLVDILLMRFVDLMMSFPTFFMILLLVTMLSPGVWVVVLVISIFAWTYPARIFRSKVLSIREREFIMAARCVGMPERRIFIRHLLPHVLSLVVVYTALRLPATIFSEASLSFLGLGVPPPNPSWGGMIRSGMRYYRVAPWIAFFPGLAMGLTVICTNLVGTGLREAMDPTRRGR